MKVKEDSKVEANQLEVGEVEKMVMMEVKLALTYLKGEVEEEKRQS